MRELKACPGCSSQRIVAFSRSAPDPEEGIHFAQSRCETCDLVFSNPMADAADLERYYANLFYETSGQYAHPDNPDLKAQMDQWAEGATAGLAKMVLPFKTSGRFFEVGFGYGSVLEAARRLGFETSGVEPSTSAVEFAREHFGQSDVRDGIFDASAWPAEYADVVYLHHVIEHVPDLPGFISGIYRLMKSAGIVIIGTENHRNTTLDYARLRWRMKGKSLPPFQTAREHTFYFSRQSLTTLLESHGFEIVKVDVYSLSLRTRLGNAPWRNPAKLLINLLLYLVDIATRRGNRIVVWARKPEQKAP